MQVVAMSENYLHPLTGRFIMKQTDTCNEVNDCWAVTSITRVDSAITWNAFVSTYLPALIVALGVGVALRALPAIAASFHVGFVAASGVVAAFLVGNFAATLPSGWLIDRYGRFPVLILGPTVTVISAVLVAWTHSFALLLALRFLNGCATQMWQMAQLAAISQNAPVGQRGRLVSWMFGMDNTGKLAGPVVGGFIAGTWGMRAPFVAYAILALIALFGVLILSRNQRSSEATHGHLKKKASNVSLIQLVAPRLAYFGVALFAGMTRGPVQADLFHLYAAFAYRLGPREIGYLATAAAAVTWPIGFVSGWMMDRFGRKRSMVPGFAGVSAAMLALAVCAYLGLSLFWYVSLFLTGIALQALTTGSIQTVGADVAPLRGAAPFSVFGVCVGKEARVLVPLFLLHSQANWATARRFCQFRYQRQPSPIY